MKSIPLDETWQVAIRLGISVFLACAIGYGIILPLDRVPWARQFSQGCKWGAITCVVTNAPVIGKVAQTGAERVLGSALGGVIGYLVYEVGSRIWREDSNLDGIMLSVAAAVVATSSVVLGKRMGLAYSAKLYAIAFLIVTFGSVDNEDTEGSGTLMLAITRVAGIAFGVLITEASAVVIFPKSASEEALRKLAGCLTKLSELNRIAWAHGPLGQPAWRAATKLDSLPGQQPNAGGKDEREPLLGGENSLHDPLLPGAKGSAEAFQAECERVLMETYDGLNKVDEYIPLAKAEICIGKLRGRLIFVPGTPWWSIGRWALPTAEIEALAVSMRRTARLIWALHLSFQEGFDENMVQMLRQQYPRQLMPQLAAASQGALDDAVVAFPSMPVVPSVNLHFLVAAVEGLLRISDYQRRRILQLMKEYRAVKRSRSNGRRGGGGASPVRAPSPLQPHGSPARGGAASPASVPEGPSLLPRPSMDLRPGAVNREYVIPRAHSLAAAARGSGDGRADALAAALALERAASPAAGERLTGGSTTAMGGGAAASAGRPPVPPGATEGRPPLPLHQTAALTAPPALLPPVRETSRSLGEAPRGLASSTTPNVNGAANPASGGALPRHHIGDGAEDHSGSGATFFDVDPEGLPEGVAFSRGTSTGPGSEEGDPRCGRAALPEHQDPGGPPGPGANSHPPPHVSPFLSWTVDQSYCGTPIEALQGLPEGLRIHVDGAGGAASPKASRAPSLSERSDPRTAERSISMRLQHVASCDLLLFPENAEGYLAKVRWYSFQFLMEQVAEEVEELHAALTDVLQKFPHPFRLP